jgi:PPOX class probable F420-dependent enzyme
MDLDEALGAARATSQSVLTTIRSSGRPQLSNVLHGVGEDGIIRISTTADRAKYANLRRTPWAALHVNGRDFWSYAVIEADAEVSEVAADPHDATVEELVALYRSLSGEHADWDDYRAAMVRDRRVVARLRPTRAYGLLR